MYCDSTHIAVYPMEPPFLAPLFAAGAALVVAVRWGVKHLASIDTDADTVLMFRFFLPE